MPIVGRSPQDCFDRFVSHLRKVMARIVPTKVPVRLTAVEGGRAQVGFVEDDELVCVSVTGPLSKYGALYFYFCQDLEAVPDPYAKASERFRLSTMRYWYRLQQTDDSQAKAIIRWEYDRQLQMKPRHHVQPDARVAATLIDLDKVHLPTGWVTLEEVLRFLIDDLGMVPTAGSGWSAILRESEQSFYEKFTSKRYVRPPPRR